MADETTLDFTDENKCDANVLNHRGLVVANLGTGMRDIHTVREWLDANDMIATAEVTLELRSSRPNSQVPAPGPGGGAGSAAGRERAHYAPGDFPG
jgi:putative aminopeptidase FrvX